MAEPERNSGRREPRHRGPIPAQATRGDRGRWRIAARALAAAGRSARGRLGNGVLDGRFRLRADGLPKAAAIRLGTLRAGSANDP